MKKQPRFFIGLSDVAGIGTTYAQVLRNLGYQASCVTYWPHPFGYRQDHHDYSLNLRKKNFFWRIVYLFFYFWKALFLFDVFIFIFGHTFFPFRNRWFVNLDLPILKLFKKKIVMVFVGCDVKCQDKPEKIIYSGCFECGERCSCPIKKKIVRSTEKYAHLILGQPDYMGLFKRKYQLFWLPIDLDQYQPNYQVNQKPIILHAPSNRDFKGTKKIYQTIERLKKEDFQFQFKIIEGKNHQSVLKALAKTDIVVDSVLGGWYGAFAAESMAFGKVVMGYLRPENLKKFSPPMINAQPKNLYFQLKKVLEMSPQQRIKQGKKARTYMEKYHDQKKIVKDLLILIKRLR